MVSARFSLKRQNMQLHMANLTPTSNEIDQVIQLLNERGNLIEYPCYGNIPKGAGNTEKVL